MNQLTEETVLESLKQIIDPDLRKDIVTLGFVRDVAIEGGDVSFRIVLTTPACPVKEQMETEAHTIVSGLEGVASVKVTMDAEVPQGRGIANNVAIPGVKNIIAVSSGKGGGGKSTVAVNLAVARTRTEGRHAAPMFGPNVPLMLSTGFSQVPTANSHRSTWRKNDLDGDPCSADKPMIATAMLHGVVGSS